MRRLSVVQRCRKKDCPGKPASEKKWCLLSGEGKALRCAPTKKQCEEHEKKVQYFKHKGSAHLTTAEVQTALHALPKRLRAAALRLALASGFAPALVRYRGKLWRLI